MGGMLGALIASFVPAGGPSFEPIATATPTGTNTVTFNSVPSTYKHLQIRVNAFVGTDAVLDMRFNGDSAGNYTQHGIFGRGASVAALGSPGTSTISILGGYDAMVPTFPNVSIIDIHDYASTTKNKTAKTFGGSVKNDTSTNLDVALTSGVWRNTAAVNSITLFSGTNFTSGSVFSLYGIKG